MAAIAEGTSVADVLDEGTRDGPADGRADGRFAWLSVALGGWIVVGVYLVVWALNHGLADDVGISPYHVVGYLGILVLAVFCVAFVVRAVRRGLPWRRALPLHHGTLGAGVLVLLAYIVVDVAWREGIGIELGIETGFAPSRILLLLGLALVSVGPLRAAVLSSDTRPAGRLPAIISTGLVLAVLGVPGAFHAAVNPWLERAPDVREDDSEIWLMDADGGHQTRLIEAGEGFELSFPVWSPDGSRIAFARWHGFHGDELGDVDVWVADADGTGQRAIADGEGWQWLPRWSPSGDVVSYTVEVQGGPSMSTGPLGRETGFGPLGPGFDDAASSAVRPDADLWRVRVDETGTPEPIVVAPGDDRSGGWSPDGTRLAFDATRDGNTEIYVVDADGSNPVRLTDNPSEDWAPSWAPDGTRIAFASDRSGIDQVFVMGADGSAVTQLTDEPAGNNGPSWSPDGDRIAFTSWRGDDQEIWSMAADGTDLQNLSRSLSTTDAVWDGSWGPDGRIAFSRAAYAPAYVGPLAREDLGVASLLIQALVMALMAIVLVSIRPPFGAFALAMGIATALAASQQDQWRFVPAAVVGGLLVDVVVRLASERRKAHVAASGSALVVVLGAGATVMATTGLGWTPTLLLGVAFAGALAGWGLAGVVRPRQRVLDPAPEAATQR